MDKEQIQKLKKEKEAYLENVVKPELWAVIGEIRILTNMLQEKKENVS